MRKQNAFTLIEVLIALMIIAIALSAAVRATNESIRASINVKNTTTAHFVAMNILSEVQTGIIALPSSDQKQGKTSMLNREWPWTITTHADGNIIRIDVKVFYKNNAIADVVGYVDEQ